MSKIKIILFFGLIFNYFQSLSQKNFIIQETNIDKNKLAQCLNTARKCEAVLLKNSPPSSLVFSDNSTLTSNAINNLSERFIAAYPKSKPSTYQDPIVERVIMREKPNSIKLTYGFLAKDQKATTDYVQMVVTFDAGANPKIVDIIVKSKAEVGVITLTGRELLFKKPEAQAPATKATPKAGAKKNTSKNPVKTTPKAATKTPTKSNPSPKKK